MIIGNLIKFTLSMHDNENFQRGAFLISYNRFIKYLIKYLGWAKVAGFREGARHPSSSPSDRFAPCLLILLIIIIS